MMYKSMKYIYVFVFFITGIFSVNAQSSINKMDADGNRDGVWRKYYSNDRIRYVGQFEHGKEVGVFKFFSASNSDNPIIIKKYHANDNLADVQFFTPSGVESKITGTASFRYFLAKELVPPLIISKP